MSNSKQKEQPNKKEWYAESLRMTAFLSPSAKVSAQNWWEDIVGELPQNEISQPKTGVKRYDGLFKDDSTEGALLLTIQPARIDWQILPLESGIPGFPRIGLFTNSSMSFQDLMLRWLENSPSLQRLAFGANLWHLAEDYNQLCKRISHYLSFDLDSNSSDFSYQINRPRESNSIKESNLKINRLSKWGVSSVFKVEIPSKTVTQNFVAQASEIALSLNLDINTMGDFPINSGSENYKKVFRELIEAGKEISEKGDIK